MKAIPNYTFYFSEEEVTLIRKIKDFLEDMEDDVYDALCEKVFMDGDEFFTSIDELYTFMLQNMKKDEN